MSEKANVYFSKEISPEKVLEMYQLLGKKLDGKVAIKLHSGAWRMLLKAIYITCFHKQFPPSHVHV